MHDPNHHERSMAQLPPMVSATGRAQEVADHEVTLDSVLAEVLSVPAWLGEQTAMRLSTKYPQFADDISDFMRMHLELDTLPRSSQSQSRVSADRFQGLSTGDQLGDYELLNELDRGGMGVVYRAKHLKLDRIVALKIIRSGELADELEVMRFIGEAKTAARLVHPGIIPIYEVGQRGALLFYTMPLIDGRTLAREASDRRLDVRESVQIVLQLANAMQHAHQRGVIHRDLKPSNVLIDQHRHVVIIDFGLAKLVQHGVEDGKAEVVGTPAYMAPERIHLLKPTQVRLENDIASDVYALGAILYFLLTKRPPFVGATPLDVLIQVRDREPLAPSAWNRKVGLELDAICGLAMEKDPSQRYQSAQALADDLQRWLSGIPIMTPSKSLTMHWNHAWRKYPGLVSHVVAITSVISIVALSHLLGLSQSNSLLQFGTLGVWLLCCFPLQRLTYDLKYWWLFGSLWGILDVACTTMLIANAESPRGPLLIAYPMLLAASALFYRARMVLGMFVLSLLGLVFLPWYTQDPSISRWDFQAIFGIGLAVLGLILMSMISRIRAMYSTSLR